MSLRGISEAVPISKMTAGVPLSNWLVPAVAYDASAGVYRPYKITIGDLQGAQTHYGGTSTTSLALSTGAKTLTTQASLSYLAGARVRLSSAANVNNYLEGLITSYNANSGAMGVTVDIASGAGGPYADWNLNLAGNQGVQGIQGIQGVSPSHKYTFNSSTAAADPGSGKFSFDGTNTTLHISETNGDGGSAQAWLDSLDSSTNTGVKATLFFVNFDRSKGLVVDVSGTLTDQGAYDDFTCVLRSSWGSPANNDVFYATSSLTGNNGGSGDFSSNTATSIDGEIILFSGTGGKTGKRATGSGLAKITSGVLSVAVAATDYAPATTGSAILKANSGGFAAAVSGTDYQAPIGTISGLVKGNGANLLTAATAGTDYVAPGTATAFSAQQYYTLATITDAANLAWTVSSGQKAKVTLGGNRTMNAVTGAVEGATYTLWVIQDATGSRTISWTTTGAGSFDFGTAGAPTLTTTASRADVLTFEAITIGGTLKLRFTGIMRGFA